jgi:Ca-activated chloride channel family protein
VNVCDEALLPYILQQNPVQQSRLPVIGLNVIASVLTIIALAGPTWQRVPSPAFRNDSGLVIALDLSRSMEAGDIKPSRLIRARYKIDDILKQRKDGQTALLVYAGDAFTVTPLTNDNATIASQLQALTPEIMPSAGSNTVLAVEKAAALFQQAGLQKGQILLITDGVNSEETSAILAKLGDYQLSILAVGTEEGAPISLPEGGFLKDDSGSIVIPKLPASTLQQLANDGHGIYQTISDNDSDIKALLAAVDKSVQNAEDNNGKNNLLLEKWDEKGVWLLLLVLPLAALNFRRGLLVMAFLLLLPLPKTSYAYAWQDLWQTKDQQAYQAFKNQDYDKAAKLFEDPAWQAAAQYKANELELKQHKTPTSATGFYNQGNVLAKASKYNEAIKAYEQSLKLDPNNADAKYNKKLVEDALKKQQQQKQQDSQNSQNSENKKQDSGKNQQKPNDKDSQKQQDNQNKQGDKANQDSQQSKNDSAEKNQPKSQQGENNKDGQPQNQQPQNQQPQDKHEQQKSQQEQQAAQAKKSQPEQKSQPAQQAAQLKEDEKKQADAQWLNRIPDDPAGLLRRKFKYQYGQRQQPTDSNAQNW